MVKTCQFTTKCNLKSNKVLTAKQQKSKLEATQRWSAICRVWPSTLTYQKFLLCISSQGQDLYSYQKLNMYVYWFSPESSYRRQRRQRRTPQSNH